MARVGDPAAPAADAPPSAAAPLRFDPARYDAWYDGPLGAYCFRLERAAVLAALRPVAGETLLDVGAGTGRFALAAAESGARVFATDPDAAVMAWARRRHGALRQVRWSAAWGQRLPFADGRFDGVFTVTALCFATEHAAIVRELHRVVRPGGRVVLGELNARAPWQRWRRLRALAPGSPYRQAHFHTVAGLEQLLREAGFTAVRHEVLLHWLPVRLRPLLALAPAAEWLGRRLLPGLGAFVVVSGVRSR